jgi:hypothetical protein
VFHVQSVHAAGMRLSTCKAIVTFNVRREALQISEVSLREVLQHPVGQPQQLLTWSPAKLEAALQPVRQLVPDVDLGGLIAQWPSILLRHNLLGPKVAALRYVLAMPKELQAQFIHSMTRVPSAGRVLACSDECAPVTLRSCILFVRTPVIVLAFPALSQLSWRDRDQLHIMHACAQGVHDRL